MWDRVKWFLFKLKYRNKAFVITPKGVKYLRLLQGGYEPCELAGVNTQGLEEMLASMRDAQT